jgi:hypothetical protein
MELPSVAYCKLAPYCEAKSSDLVTDGKNLLKAVKKGKIPMERIDDMATR